MATRADILEIARELVQTCSYQGFSFQDIADAVGIRKASLYHHFPSKEQLAIALVQQYRADFRNWTQQMADRDPEKQLDGYFRSFGEDLGAGRRICPGGAFVAGWERLPDDVRAEVSALFADQEAWLTRVIRTGIEFGALSADNGPPEHQASAIVSAVQGGLLLARTRGERRVFQHSLELLRSALGSSESRPAI